MNDGSTDSSGKICDEYAKNYENINVIHQTNGGISKARNTGLEWVFKHSDSQWIAFIDSDDWVHPEYLSTLLHAATSSNLPISICSFVRTAGEEPKILEKELSVKVCSSEEFFVTHNTSSILLWGKLCKKDLYSKIRFPIDKIHEDEFVSHKLLFSTDKVATIEAPPYYYFKNEHGIMGVAWSPKRLILLDAYKERLSFLWSRGFETAYAWQAMWYYKHVRSYEKLISQSSPEIIKQYTPFMRKHFRTALHHTRQSGQIPFHGNEHLYEKVFPHFMSFYWYWKSLCKKFSKRK